MWVETGSRSMQSLADRIRRARRIKGWSQSQLAHRLGVSTSAVGHWERPNGPLPSTEHLIEIAMHLSVRVEWLALGHGDIRASGREIQWQGVTLHAEEQALLERYKTLPEPSRALLSQFLDTLTRSTSTVAGFSRGRRHHSDS
mgnify:FL=1